MSTIDQPPAPVEVAIEEAIRRLKAAWPGYRWPEAYEREHRDALRWVKDPAVIGEAVTNLIRGTAERYPPPVGAVVAAARAIDERRRGSNEWHRKQDTVRFIEAAPDHRDPPGTVRSIAVYRDGKRYPPHARAAGE